MLMHTKKQCTFLSPEKNQTFGYKCCWTQKKQESLALEEKTQVKKMLPRIKNNMNLFP
jgi:hypothetical protein